MKTIYKNLLVCFSLSALFSSCETDLDLSNPNSLSLEELLQTNNAFEVLSNGVMDSYQKVPANEFYLLELRSDNVRANTENGNFPAINAYNIDVNNGDVASYYSNNYATIFRANTVIENRFLATEEQQYAVGEAFFMRALCHFNLVRAYRNIPYIDKVLDVNSEEALDYPQLPEAEVYEKIIADFTTSIAFLNGNTVNKNRPSEGAAICLAAKAYLSQPQPNYSEAELLLASVVESNSFGYELLFVERDDADNFVFDADPTDPTVDVLTDNEYFANLALAYGRVFGNESTGNYQDSEVVLDGEWVNNAGLELNEEIIFSIAYDASASEIVVTADTDLDDQIETDAEAFSFAMTAFGPSNGVNLATLDFLEVMTPELQPVRFPATIRQITYVSPADITDDIFNAKYPTAAEAGDNDWIILRYADVLLLYAEAIMGNESATIDTRAVNAYNQVRERAGFEPVVSFTKAELLAERRVEFVYENQRLYDLIRFGEADNVLQAFSDANTLFYNSERKYLPFPQRELDNLPGFYTQNPGY